ncbi:MAG: phosphopantetheine-binding protein [Candidatus Sumerlaeota bacterium]|nr:phosphopantetheine-binding protein [Candidatus Sumerlaeota bacterium]
MKQEVKGWVMGFFQKKKEIPGQSEQDKLDVDYFAAGLLDSLAVVDLILSIEERFHITLGPENMQDRRFCRIGGLSEIISEMLDRQNH